MLMSMKSQIEAMRALSYVTAASLDLAHEDPDEAVRKEHRAFVEFMIPVVKGWCTRNGDRPLLDGRAGLRRYGLYRRDRHRAAVSRRAIVSIYEGTTGIQALDLVGRKLIRDMGTTATAIVKDDEEIRRRARPSTTPTSPRFKLSLCAVSSHLLATSQVRSA
jgi:alkylation response protein AidB-like acyl-CoA dehydrogenase